MPPSEEDLQQSEEDRVTFFSMPLDLLCIAGFDGFFKRLNPTWETILGWSRQELMSKPFIEFVHPDDRPATLAEAAALQQRASTTIGFENRYLCKDGSYRWLSWSASALPVRQMIYATAKDVTRQKQLEQDLSAAVEAAGAANRAKSEFLTNVSHEVRTPLSAILSNVDMLLDPRLTVAERGTAVRAIHRNGTYLLQIINNILDLSKIEAGKLEASIERCSPWQIVQEAVASLHAPASEKNLRLEVRKVGRLPRTVLTDSTLVRQILTNFISNAVKFTDSGRRIVVQLSVKNTPTRLAFEVKDQGIGMTREHLDRLFVTFEQADSSSTRKYGGAGLGLRISKRLSDALGGEIEVSSSPGQGTLFTFLLPLPDSAETDWVEASQLDLKIPSDSYATASQVPAMAGRILLAEDNMDVQYALVYGLNRAGLQVESVENGALAVQRALTEPFDLIIMDMQMPVLDGCSATTTLRQSGYCGPIIALTAHAMRGDREKYMACGLTDYLTKPLSIEQLLEAIAKYLPPGISHSDKSEDRPPQ